MEYRRLGNTGLKVRCLGERASRQHAASWVPCCACACILCTEVHYCKLLQPQSMSSIDRMCPLLAGWRSDMHACSMILPRWDRMISLISLMYSACHHRSAHCHLVSLVSVITAVRLQVHQHALFLPVGRYCQQVLLACYAACT